jgi:glycosyltransferase involved in cell wall biosynthesis
MKVVHFIASIDISSGGTTTYMKLLSEELTSQGLQIIVATGTSKKPLELSGVNTKFYITSIKRWFALKKEFKIFLATEKPDIVHINGIWNPQNALFQKTAKNLGIKVILSPHGMLEPYILNRNPLKKKIALMLYQNKALHAVDAFHATAREEAINIQNLGFKKPISIIPNGINLTEVKKVKTNYGTKKMVFLSRIHPKKGIELLLSAWRQIETKGWSLQIAGNGDVQYIEKLKKSASDLTNVVFVGPLFGESKWDFLRSGDVMVLPTYSENFGIVVVESLAVGVPVITTKGTPWEELNTCNCGWWIPLGINSLQSKLQEAMLTKDNKLAIMGKNGRQLIEDKYSVKSVAINIKKMYSKILNNQ